MPWKNKQDRAAQNKKRYEQKKEQILKQKKEYNDLHKEDKKKYDKKYRFANSTKINIRIRKRRKEDPLFALKTQLRKQILNSFKKHNIKKPNKTTEILGCSFEEFKSYLESKFESWMNWDNRGLYNGKENYGWDIDHIIPLSSAKTIEDLIKLNHYTNLQPLCSFKNRCIKRDNF